MTVHYGGKGSRHTYWCILQKATYGASCARAWPGQSWTTSSVAGALGVGTCRRWSFRWRQQGTSSGSGRADEAVAAAAGTSGLRAERAASSTGWWSREPAGGPQPGAGVEEKLAAHQKLEEEYHRFLRVQPRVLSEEEREAIRRLAANIPALWEAETTTDADRKEIIRQVVHRVTVDTVAGASGCGWSSTGWVEPGPRGSGPTDLPAGEAELLPELCERVRALVAEDLNAEDIAERLGAEGYLSPGMAGASAARGF